MESFMYSVFDVLAKEFANPFLAKTDEVAVRLVRNSLRNQQVDSSEYKVFRLGIFDSEKGSIAVEKMPVDIFADLKFVEQNFPYKKITKIKQG